jgi:uncharacterized membrane-anchored protein
MKLGKFTVAGASLALLLVQLVIVSTVAAKYFYQRITCPRVWTRTVTYDPEMLMRGRYVSLQLLVDGCGSTLPSAKQAAMPRSVDGVPVGNVYTVRADQPVQFPARLKVEGNKLVAIRIPEADRQSGGQRVTAWPGSSCTDLRLDAPVDYFIGESAANPATVHAGQELWIEVSVPPSGPPRPIQLALKEGAVWKPLTYR